MRKWIVGLVMLVACLSVAGTSRAEEYSNPAAEFSVEVFSFMKQNGVGGGAYWSRESGDVVPLLSFQLGKSRHDWFKWGLAAPVADDNVLRALGAYGGVNGNKIIEKVIGYYPESIEVVGGYSCLYYFSNAADDDIDKGGDSGWFFLFQKGF